MKYSNKISIIIPLYNREYLIVATIHSILAQTNGNFECIIIDDCSTDNSFSIVSDLIKDDSRFILKHRISAKKGASVCRNEGIDLASGDYLMFVDSDDLMDPKCIQQRLDLISQKAKQDFYVFNVALFNHENYYADYLCADITAKNDIEGFIKYTGGWHTSSTLFSAGFLKMNHYFEEEALSWQDVEFHIRALLKTDKYIKFQKSFPDVFIRISDFSRISNNKWTLKKLSSRVKTITMLDYLIFKKVGDKLRLDFFYFYFRYLEIAARTLNAKKFLEILAIAAHNENQSESMAFKIMKIYLKIQNFLSTNNMSFLGSVLFRISRILLGKKLTIPQKKMKLKKSINIKERLEI